MAQWNVLVPFGYGGCGEAGLIETPKRNRYWLCRKLKGERSTLVVRPDLKTGPCATCRHNRALSAQQVQDLKARGREFVLSFARTVAKGMPVAGGVNAARDHLRTLLAKGGGVDKTKPAVREVFREVLLASVERGLAPDAATLIAEEEGLLESERVRG